MLTLIASQHDLISQLQVYLPDQGFGHVRETIRRCASERHGVSHGNGSAAVQNCHCSCDAVRRWVASSGCADGAGGVFFLRRYCTYIGRSWFVESIGSACMEMRCTRLLTDGMSRQARSARNVI